MCAVDYVCVCVVYVYMGMVPAPVHMSEGQRRVSGFCLILFEESLSLNLELPSHPHPIKLAASKPQQFCLCFLPVLFYSIPGLLHGS